MRRLAIGAPLALVALAFAPALACTPAPAPAAPEPLALGSVTPASSAPEPSDDAPLSCARPLPVFAFPATPQQMIVPQAGQMTEQAAQAKRLFDSERWDQAIAALLRVENGDSGDDEGNKQLAQYHRAVALHHSGRATDAAALFLTIASRPHLKHAETLLWLTKLADATPVVARGMAFYEPAMAERFRNPEQLDVYQTALFLMGRERFERGAKSEARALFERVDPSSRWSPLVKGCLARLGGT